MSKFILVTGAYGGMGKAAVAELKNQGYTVFALDRVVGEPEEGVFPIAADITSEQAVAAAMAQVRQTTDHLEGVVHFAGVYRLNSLVEMSGEELESTFAVNLFGAARVNRIFLPLLAPKSRILHITSELAPLDPLPFTGIYGITKTALDRYAYSLRMELQLRGSEVCVLRAGAVETGMLGASTAALDRFCEETTLYCCNAKRFKQIVDRVEARNIPPCKVAKKVAAIMAKKRARFAFCINRNPLLLLLDALPSRFQFWIIKRILK